MAQKCHHEQQLDEPMQNKLTRNVTKILLVDDDPDVATTFKAILQDVGFLVNAYEDPLIALSDFKPRFYDLIILEKTQSFYSKLRNNGLESEMLGGISCICTECGKTHGVIMCDGLDVPEVREFLLVKTESRCYDCVKDLNWKSRKEVGI